MDLGDITVRRYVVEDARALHDAIVESDGHLRPWMPWMSLEPLTVADRTRLLSDFRSAWDEGRDFALGIFEGGRLVGSTGLHLRGSEGTVDIGYWMRSTHAGRGIATRVVQRLCVEALGLEGIDRVRILHDAANAASRRVAEKSGFTRAGEIRRQPEAPGESGVLLVWIRERGR